MKPEYEIVCIQKQGNFVLRCFMKNRISEIGYKLETGETVVVSTQRAIDLIKNDRCGFYVKDGGNKLAVVVKQKSTKLIKSKSGEYLRTEHNGVATKSLYRLPKCATNRG